MKKIVSVLFEKIGIDGAIFYTSLGRILQGAGGLITLLLISRFMTQEEQGFYYTFASVLGIQVFFELGLVNILTQFVAHETAHLKIEGAQIEGEGKHRSRLASILRFTLKWYALFSGMLIITLIIVGNIYFQKYAHHSVEWRLPWLLVSIFTGLNVFILPVMAILQGMHKVKEMARILMAQQIFAMGAVWIGIVQGAGLYIPAINAGACFLFLLLSYVFSPYLKLLANSFYYTMTEKIDYRAEIFPYQWKMALSWMSAYLIYQLLNPIVFAYYGAVVAGQVGMTLTLINAMIALVTSWCNTKTPLWSSLIAQHRFSELNFSLDTVVKQITFVSVVGVLCAILFIVIGNYLQLPLMQRILPLWLSIVFFMVVPFNAIIAAWAAYLRCNKKEPYVYFSMLYAIISVAQIYVSVKYFNLSTLIVGYVLSYVCINFPVAYYIFKTKKREYYGL